METYKHLVIKKKKNIEDFYNYKGFLMNVNKHSFSDEDVIEVLLDIAKEKC